MNSVTYTSGDSVAVVADGLAILAAIDDDQRLDIEALWDCVGERPDIPMLLELLSAGGLASMPEFAAIVWTADVAQVVIRGTFVVEVMRDVMATLAAENVSTWAEHRIVLDDVYGVRLRSSTSSETARLPIRAGVVRASDILVGHPAPARVHEAVVDEDTAAEANADLVPVPERAGDPAATIDGIRDSRFDAMFGDTIAGRRPEDAAIRESVDDVPATDLAPEPRSVVIPVFRLKLSTGREVVVDRPVLIGRSPQARNTTSDELPMLVGVDDPFVSGTHLEFATAEDGLVATDVSSNGTILTYPDAAEAPMRKGEPTPMSDGAVLRISDGISITVSIT